VSPQIVAAVFAFLCVGAFLLGLRVYRMAEPPGGTTVEQTRRFGRLLMMASTGVFLFLIAAIAHGDLGIVRAAKAIR
jgi:hypothetical protein